MSAYMRRRLLLTLPTLVGISVILFAWIQLLPGGPANVACGENCTTEEYEELREALGLNDPVAVQYWRWVSGVVRGDFGESIISHAGIGGELKSRGVATFELGIMAMFVGCVIAIPVGVVSALKQDRAIDYAVRSVAVALIAIPSFWLAIVVISVTSRYDVWTPPINYAPLIEDPVANFQIMAVPALLLGLTLTGSLMRLTRTQMLEVLRQDYVRTARAKGLRGSVVVYRHAFRNALIPIITVIGVQVPIVVGGSVILETIFSIPGMGRYLMDGIVRSDIPVIQAVNLVVAVAVLLTNVLIDYLYTVVDPQVRL